MQTLSRLTAAAAALALVAALAPSTLLDAARAAGADDPAAAAQQSGALERGYRTGYSDGYQAGYRDSVESAARDYRSKEDYRRADRVYVQAYGSLEDYRDGYRQGFASGYETGYDRRGFDSTVPAGLGRRGTRDDDDSSSQTQRANANTGRPAPQIQTRDDRDDGRADDDRAASDSAAGRAGSSSSAPPAGGVASSGAPFEIPQDTTLRVELLNNLSTEVSQRGDRFEARVLEPAPYANMVVTGRVSSVRRPGKIRGSGQLQLTFQQIRTNDGRWANFSAQVIEVVEKRTDSGIGEVDEEGGVSGKSTTKDDVTKVGAASGIGAVIGAIAGGGKGAAIGAVVGAGIGTGGVLSARGKDIRLERGQELMIRSATDTRIQ